LFFLVKLSMLNHTSCGEGTGPPGQRSAVPG